MSLNEVRLDARAVLSPWQIRRATELRKYKIGWDIVADQVGSSRYVLRSHFEPGYREKILANAQRSREGRSEPRRLTRRPHDGPNPRNIAGIKDHPSVIVPAEVWAEREARLALQPQSLTALLMGDPPPGRSALEKRRIRLIVNNAL